MQLSNLSFRQDNQDIFRELNYTFDSGLLYGILCLHNYEASALLKLLAGILTPSAGSVLIDGVDVHSTKPDVLKKNVGNSAFVFERLGLISNLNIKENLLLLYNYVYPKVPPDEKLENIKLYFDKFKLSEKILTERPARLTAQVYKLMVIIRAFIIKPKVILFDMPFTDLEVSAKKILIDEITSIREKQESIQIFYSNTDVLFERADKGIILQDGKFICEGSWDELFVNEDPSVRKIITNYLSIGLNETEI